MSDPVKVGGPYVESKDHVPDPTDMGAQFNTSGVGAHGRIEEVAPIFEVDKVATAQEILNALDPKNTKVSSDRVQLPNALEDNESARKNLIDLAKARVKEGVEVGGPTPAQREAEEKGKEGNQAAVSQERSNAVVGSPASAGNHSDDKSGDDKSGDNKSGDSKSSDSKSSDSKSSDSKSGDNKSSGTATKTASSSNK